MTPKEAARRLAGAQPSRRPLAATTPSPARTPRDRAFEYLERIDGLLPHVQTRLAADDWHGAVILLTAHRNDASHLLNLCYTQRQMARTKKDGDGTHPSELSDTPARATPDPHPDGEEEARP